jgi:hypothetical protein
VLKVSNEYFQQQFCVLKSNSRTIISGHFKSLTACITQFSFQASSPIVVMLADVTLSCDELSTEARRMRRIKAQFISAWEYSTPYSQPGRTRQAFWAMRPTMIFRRRRPTGQGCTPWSDLLETWSSSPSVCRCSRARGLGDACKA